MSEHGPQFDRAQRQFDSQSPPDEWSDEQPQCVEDALPCNCSPDGHAVYRPAQPKAGMARIECSNPRCGRMVVLCEGRTVEQGMELWDKDVQQETCIHSWFLQPEEGKPCRPVYKCCHCGTTKL